MNHEASTKTVKRYLAAYNAITTIKTMIDVIDSKLKK